MRFTTLAVGALAAVSIVAHPGHDHQQEMAERRAMLQHSRRDLSSCWAKMEANGLESRSLQRRSETASQLKKKRSVPKRRDISSLLTISHESSEDYTIDTPETTIFASNNSCVLSPEVTEGPYYVSGEYIRENVVETQSGVPLALELQALDIETCEPIVGAFLEIWHCNSTGVYSGVSASGNGNSAAEASNLNSTWLRGVQTTDSDGVVQFDTLFPGHYTGRATHIHIIVHLHATAQANGTLLDTTASHVGQVFFDQDLITEVEATAIYASNTQTLTSNKQDSILAEEATTSDPFVQYVRLGDTIEDGLFGWIAFGVNTSLSKTVSAAATYYETGGQSNTDTGGGGGPGGTGGAGGGPGGHDIDFS